MYDESFLKALDAQKNKVLYIRIIALNINEQPIETIEGTATTGSINIDGASALRRTCQLSMVSKEVNISSYYWAMNNKFALEVGVENTIDTKYPNIIWFKQGVYIITSFSQALNASGYTINISGKDKMCRLNGEVGGTLNSSVDFGKYEEIDAKGNRKFIQMPLKDIIRNAVHQYGGEPLHNIIINGLDDNGLELQAYKYDSPLYLIREVKLKRDENDLLIPDIKTASEYINGTLDGDLIVWNNGFQTTIKELPYYDPLYESVLDGKEIQTDSFKLGSNKLGEGPPIGYSIMETVFTLSPSSDKFYAAAKINYGETAGYKLTELTYTGDLIANIGESVTSVLDKIKNMLGSFEYFYDTDGRFIFQKQETYLNTSWSPITKDGNGEIYVEALAVSSPTIYTFNNSELITTFNNTPNLSNVKNDYTVWGARKGAGGNEVPIHMRLAIDEKPVKYTTIQVEDNEMVEYNQRYGVIALGQNSKTYTTENYDWRELIYQMALDYRKYNHLDDFHMRVANANKDTFPTGITGYEQYYIDLEGFWRQLYNYETQYTRVYSNPYAISESLDNYYEKVTEYKPITETPANGQKAYIEKGGVYEQAAPPYDTKKHYYYEKVESYKLFLGIYNSETILYQISEEFYGKNHIYQYWNRKVDTSPDLLNFWFDFLSGDGELNQFSVRKIGSRQKVQNSKDVKSIYYKSTPTIIFYDDISSVPPASNAPSGYSYFVVGDKHYKSMFTPSSQGKTAKDEIDNLLYNHSYCMESVSITSIPIYYLEPNKCIYVNDQKTGINGEYIMSKLSIPLSYNGTMTITATKAVKRIY